MLQAKSAYFPASLAIGSFIPYHYATIVPSFNLTTAVHRSLVGLVNGRFMVSTVMLNYSRYRLPMQLAFSAIFLPKHSTAAASSPAVK